MNLFDLFRTKRPKRLIPERPLPDFLVIGVQKGGTSWLWNQLRQHPEIWMPPFKELQFFNHEFIPSHRSWTSNHCDKAIANLTEKKRKRYNNSSKQVWETYLSRISQNPKPTLDWYKACFSFPVIPGARLGDVSPAYCTIPEEGVAYAKELLPDAKIIMIVRHPLQRIISHLRMKMSNTPRKQRSLTPAQWHGYVDDANLYQRAAYSEYVPLWDRYFGEQITYVPFDLISQNPDELLRRVTQHIGIRQFTPRAAEKPIHVTEKHPIPRPIENLLAERTAGEWAYLQSRFPAEFTRLCQR